MTKPTRTYPSGLPQPVIDGYAINVDMGLIRNSMETGRFRQRRRYKTMPQHFTLSFIMKTNQLHNWQLWVDLYAYSYFNIQLFSYKTEKGKCSTHSIRFTSNLAISPMANDVIRVDVTAEELEEAVVVLDDMWIIAHTPAAPATPKWVLSHTPGTAPNDLVICGTPSNPSARV